MTQHSACSIAGRNVAEKRDGPLLRTRQCLTASSPLAGPGQALATFRTVSLTHTRAPQRPHSLRRPLPAPAMHASMLAFAQMLACSAPCGCASACSCSACACAAQQRSSVASRRRSPAHDASACTVCAPQQHRRNRRPAACGKQEFRRI